MEKERCRGAEPSSVAQQPLTLAEASVLEEHYVPLRKDRGGRWRPKSRGVCSIKLEDGTFGGGGGH